MHMRGPAPKGRNTKGCLCWQLRGLNLSGLKVYGLGKNWGSWWRAYTGITTLSPFSISRLDLGILKFLVQLRTSWGITGYRRIASVNSQYHTLLKQPLLMVDYFFGFKAFDLVTLFWVRVTDLFLFLSYMTLAGLGWGWNTKMWNN